jgi:hypothetical protein
MPTPLSAAIIDLRHSEREFWRLYSIATIPSTNCASGQNNSPGGEGRTMVILLRLWGDKGYQSVVATSLVRAICAGSARDGTPL